MFLFCIIIIIILDVGFISLVKERNGVDLDWWGSEEEKVQGGRRENHCQNTLYEKNYFQQYKKFSWYWNDDEKSVQYWAPTVCAILRNALIGISIEYFKILSGVNY